MLQFTSKVQHKTYEKGEFSEEQKRSLAETILLINTFPWDSERTLTIIQLTGPSVTIMDDRVNYLKVGLYFNGKFCLYYLDRNNHLYEYHTAEMNVVTQLVTDFFAGTLNLDAFEKHLISIGSKGHFETAYFEYRPATWNLFFMGGFLVLYGLSLVISFTTLVFKTTHGFISLLIVIPLLGYFYFVFRLFKNIYVNRNSYLEISRGNEVFTFGYTEDTAQVYHKTDIKEIKCYGKPTGSKTNASLGFFQLTFKNGNTIRIPNVLISAIDFKGKFADNMENTTIPFTYKSINIFNTAND